MPGPLNRSSDQRRSLTQSSCRRSILLTGRGREGAKSCDGEKAWSSVNCSVLSGVDGYPNYSIYLSTCCPISYMYEQVQYERCYVLLLQVLVPMIIESPSHVQMYILKEQKICKFWFGTFYTMVFSSVCRTPVSQRPVVLKIKEGETTQIRHQNIFRIPFSKPNKSLLFQAVMCISILEAECTPITTRQRPPIARYFQR